VGLARGQRITIIPMTRHPFVLESPLTPKECVQQLRTSIADRGMGLISFGDFDSNQLFYGRIIGNEIELRKRKAFFFRNEYAPRLFAKLIASPQGTRIEGYFGLDTRPAMVISILGAIIISLFFRQSHGRQNGNALVGWFFGLLFLAQGFLMPRALYFVAFDHEQELMDFVKGALGASEITPTSNSHPVSC
jgi:hypothetical protein